MRCMIQIVSSAGRPLCNVDHLIYLSLGVMFKVRLYAWSLNDDFYSLIAWMIDSRIMID